jgi:hypothetical protein
MNPISRIFGNAVAALGYPRIVPPVGADEIHTRAGDRFDAEIPVCIGSRGKPLARGTLVSLSLQGAAIRIDDAAEWLVGLDQGDELRMTGLLGDSMSCWVVVVDSDLLRVHFSADTGQRKNLFDLMGSLLRH